MGKTKRKDDRRMDAQVLLLMDPGAELGWAVLSDTLPSAGGEREHTCHQHRLTSEIIDSSVTITNGLSSGYNVSNSKN